jgi:Leucine-rich repeat (LRR) protein
MKFFTLILFLFIGKISVAFSQSTPLLDSVELEAADIYFSLKEALQSPEKVYRLHLKGKGLSSIPESVFKLPNLQELVLSRNKFTEIPPEIVRLENLQRLNFSKNKLRFVNPVISQLKHLKYLIISQNDIVDLPKELATMDKLEFIDLWSNELSSVPPEFKTFKNLKKIDFRVILLNERQQDEIQQNLPKGINALFSPGCNCGN